MKGERVRLTTSGRACLCYSGGDAAASALDEARGLGAGCPQRYAVMLNLGLAQGWDAEAYDRLFEEATAFEPDYPPYYVTKAIYPQPRWHGRPGDWVRFAESAADLKVGKVGGALYYMIIDGVGRSDGRVPPR